jgi:hypothetical protein
VGITDTDGLMSDRDFLDPRSSLGSVFEEDDYIRIHFVNQLTQDVEKSYSYPILTFDDTIGTAELIERVLDEAKTTTDYKAYDFQLEPESRVVYEVITRLMTSNSNPKAVWSMR